MSVKVLLITFPGYPNEPFNFMPDNGLANLAAALVAKGHHAVIWDCMTVDIIQRLFPYEYREPMTEVVGKVMCSIKRGEKPSSRDLDRYYRVDEEMKRLKKKKVEELGREIALFVARNGFDFVGMKLWTGGGFAGSIAIASEIKKINKGIPVIGGGPHVDWFMEKIFSVTDIFDALAYGEGEEVITLLAESVEKKLGFGHIPNLIYRDKGETIITRNKVIGDLNTLPSPLYDAAVYPAMRGNAKIKAALVEESRGCPNSCNFCVHPGKSGKKRRLVKAAKVVDELERIMYNYDIHAFRLSGSNPPAQLLTGVAEEILRRGLKVRYSAYAHVRGFAEEDFTLLKQSGCSTLSFGVESGSQKILDESINKSVTVAQIKDTLHKCKRSGIKISTSIIMPAPLETDETMKETMDLLLEVRPDSTIVCFPTLIYGTEWERNKERYGFQIQDPVTLFKEAMVYDINHFAPPVLWAPLSDYRINGKTFKEICEETAFFTQRLENENLTTQLFDQNLLLSEFAAMEPRQFGKVTHEFLRNGDHEAMQLLVAEMNERIQSHGVVSLRS